MHPSIMHMNTDCTELNSSADPGVAGQGGLSQVCTCTHTTAGWGHCTCLQPCSQGRPRPRHMGFRRRGSFIWSIMKRWPPCLAGPDRRPWPLLSQPACLLAACIVASHVVARLHVRQLAIMSLSVVDCCWHSIMCAALIARGPCTITHAARMTIATTQRHLWPSRMCDGRHCRSIDVHDAMPSSAREHTWAATHADCMIGAVHATRSRCDRRAQCLEAM